MRVCGAGRSNSILDATGGYLVKAIRDRDNLLNERLAALEARYQQRIRSMERSARSLAIFFSAFILGALGLVVATVVVILVGAFR